MIKTCGNCSVAFKRVKGLSDVQWSLRRYCSGKCRGKACKGVSKRHAGSFKTGDDSRRIVQEVGRGHYLWKEDASYSSKHKWIAKHHKKIGVCENCLERKNTDWANISKEYKRDREDYKELCRKCHIAYDRKKVAQFRSISRVH